MGNLDSLGNLWIKTACLVFTHEQVTASFSLWLTSHENGTHPSGAVPPLVSQATSESRHTKGLSHAGESTISQPTGKTSPTTKKCKYFLKIIIVFTVFLIPKPHLPPHSTQNCFPRRLQCLSIKFISADERDENFQSHAIGFLLSYHSSWI